MNRKKILLSLLSFLLIAALALPGCGANPAATPNDAPVTATAQPAAPPASAQPEAPAVPQTEKSGIPKYIFLFIGDGMSFPQVTSLGFYNGTMEKSFTGTLADPTPDNIPEAAMPSFLDFPVVGACTTYDASKFVTDSASAATAIACGVKALDGALGVDVYNNSVPSITEILREKHGYKIGILTSVSLNHATPAGFYAHVPSRNDLHDISKDMVKSGFEFFGGGGLKLTDEQREEIFASARETGYTIAQTYEDINALNASSGKVIAMNPVVDKPSVMALDFDIDRQADDFNLAPTSKRRSTCWATINRSSSWRKAARSTGPRTRTTRIPSSPR